MDLVNSQKVKAFSTNIQALEGLCRSFIFREELKIEGNLHRLTQMLAEILSLQEAEAKLLQEFLIESNLPIEVNLRPLKAKQLANLLQEWLGFAEKGPYSNQCLKHLALPNTLFKRVIYEQKQTIKGYFSKKQNNSLFPDSIFNLLQQITAGYFLYDSAVDNQTFFKKESSILKLNQIAKEFCSQRVYDRNSLYVNEQQFEQLIAFWEKQNPDLILLDTPRSYEEDMSVQTDQVSKVDHQVQTTTPLHNLLDILNLTMSRLTFSTAQSSPKDLAAIQRIYAFFRSQRSILLNQNIQDNSVISQTKPLAYIQKSKTSVIPKKQLDIIVNPNSILTTFTPRYASKHICTFEKNIVTSKNSTSASNYTLYSILSAQQISPKSFEHSIRKIYIRYSQAERFTLTALNNFLKDFGIRERQGLISSLIQIGLLKNTFHVSFEEFKSIIQGICDLIASIDRLMIQQFSKSLPEISKSISRQGRKSTFRKDQNICNQKNPYCL